MTNSRSSKLLLSILVSLLTVTASVLLAMAITDPGAKITAGDIAAGDNFSSGVSISNGYALIGSLLDDDDGDGSGSAYIFKHNGSTWVELTKLTASDAAAFDNFGGFVHIDGDIAIVTTARQSSNTGAAYVFEKNLGGVDNWGERKKLTASNAGTNAYFGSSVYIDGDRTVIGAERANSNIGAAYIFERDSGGADNWGEIKIVTPADGASADFFGVDVAIDGDTLVVGANQDDDAGSASGSAYIYYKDTGGVDNWGQVKKLAPLGDHTHTDNFGRRLGISGDYILVSSFNNNNFPASGPSAGTAYMFKRNEGGADNWGQILEINASDQASPKQFGRGVGFAGDYALVGAIRDNDIATDAGAAYIFEKDFGGVDNWGQSDKIYDADGAMSDSWGEDVQTDGLSAIVGSVVDNSAAGSVVIFNIAPPLAPDTLFVSTDNSGNADLTWVDNAGTETGYNIYYDTVNVQPGSPNDTNSASDNTYTASGLTPSTQYYFWVTAENTEGESDTGTTDAMCGNTLTEGSETCDDGNTTAGDGCNATCQLESCGDLIVQPGEECDGGFLCTLSCTYDTVCTLPSIAGTEMIIPLPIGHSTLNNIREIVKIKGEYAFITTALASDFQINIYKFDGSDWNFLKSIPSPGANNDAFGVEMDTNEDASLLIATAQRDSANQGKAYIYGKDVGGVDNWGLIQTLTASDGQADDSFGFSVEIDGNDAFVGAHTAPGNALDGAVYVFQKDLGGVDNWGELKKITGATDGYFGISMDLEDSRLVVGEIGVNAGAGRIKIFERNSDGAGGILANNWGLITSVTGDDTVAPNLLGIKVALEGDRVLAGMFDQAAADNYVYVFEKNEDGPNQWGNTIKFRGNDTVNGDFFGVSALELDGDVAAIGAYGHNGFAGAVYTFYRNQGGINAWGQLQKIESSDNAGTDRFGQGIDMSDGKLLVYAPIVPVKQGYIYDVATCPLSAPSSSGGSSSGGITSEPGSPVDRTCNSPKMVDLPSTLQVEDTAGKPTVHLTWENPGLDSSAKIEVLRNGIQIASLGSSTTSYEDADVDSNVCLPGTVCRIRQYTYTLRTKNECGEKKKGSVGVADINPAAPAGTPIAVTGDLSLIVKDGFNALLKERFSELAMLNTQELDTLIEQKGQVPTEALSEVRSYFATREVSQQDTGITQLRQEANESLRTVIEPFFEGASQATNVLIEVEDKDGNAVVPPIQTKTDIYGQAKNLNFGTFLSGEPYTISLTLSDERFVLPRTRTVTVNNPVPTTVSGVTTFSAHLNLTIDRQFCFGDFEEDGDIDLNDIIELKNLVQSEGGAIENILKTINLDGLAGFDLSDVMTWLGNYQCSIED